jgi:hypothetical protein
VPNSGPYTFTVAATNLKGTSGPSNASGNVDVYTGATFHPIPLIRVVDSRIGLGTTQLLANQPVTLQFTGPNYGIPVGATAITGTVVAIGGNYTGTLILSPNVTACNQYGSVDNVPVASDTRPNGFTIGLTDSGSANVLWCDSGTKQFVLDVSGYYANDTTGGTYHPLVSPTPPVRIVDTRNNVGITGALPAGVVKTFQVTGSSSIPTGATAITGNATVVGGSASGSITLGSSLTATPGTSTVNFPANDTRSVGVTLGLTSDGKLSVVYPAGSGSVGFVLDVTGYFTNDVTGYGFHAVATPARLLDTRVPTGLSGKFNANTCRGIPVAGYGPVPASATAVTGNMTVVNDTNSWTIYAGPVSTGSPPTSTINFPTGDTRANGLTSGLGSIYLYATYVSSAGKTTDLVFDVTGFFQ